MTSPRRDRDGSPLEPTAADHTPPDDVHFCLNGWLGDDDEGRPIPCLTCRPHLAGQRKRPPRPTKSTASTTPHTDSLSHVKHDASEPVELALWDSSRDPWPPSSGRP